MSKPTISIVTPSFNQAEFVEETLRSVLDQGYSNLEYIVVDGASSDGSVAIIERYRERLHYFISEKDSGHANALNKGFSLTTGEIMAWINSDDKYLPWTLQTVAEIFSLHPDVQWIMGIPSWWNDKGALIGSEKIYKNSFDYLDGSFKWIQQESVFWRRSLWERAGGFLNEDYRLMVDGELWSRFFLHEDLWHVNCILSGYREHGKNRAHLFEADCDREMEKAIRVMRSRIDQSANRCRHYPMLTYDGRNSSWIKSTKRRRLSARNLITSTMHGRVRRAIKRVLARR